MKQLLCNQRHKSPIVRWCLDEILQMEEYDLNVNYTLHINGAGLFEPPNLVFVYQCFPEDPFAEIKTLFHELRHFFQFQTRMFDFNPKPYTCEFPPVASPQELSLYRFQEYLEYPWELDASSFALKTSRSFWQTDLGKSFKQDFCQPPPVSDFSSIIPFDTDYDPKYPM